MDTKFSIYSSDKNINTDNDVIQFIQNKIKEQLEKRKQDLKDINVVYVYFLIGYKSKNKFEFEYETYNEGKIENKSILRVYLEILKNTILASNLIKEFPYDVNTILSFDVDIKDLVEKYINTSKEDNNINFIPVYPKYKMEKLILNEEIKEDIIKTISFLKKKHILYDKWGFKEVEPAPRAILNFYGPSGTGKTMAAHAIASCINMKILPLSYADIESKYVGDAPKNLVKAFSIAERENAILFFDEADSFLGKRTTSVSSHADQAMNSLRSQMLILLEDFSGIVIFATNLIKNYDRAFETRIFKHIKFDLPNAISRKELIKIMIPEKVPLKEKISNDILDKLVELSEGFSGRDIKNAVKDALINTLHLEKAYVESKDFINSFEKYRKGKEILGKETNNSILSKEKLEKEIKKSLDKNENYSYSLKE